METRTKNDRGVAGLTILLSLVTMLFVIGLLVMIFSLMGGEMRDTTYDVTTVSVVNETVSVHATTGVHSTLDGRGFRDGVCSNITSAYNGTSGKAFLVGNFSQASFSGDDNCLIYNETSTSTWASEILVSYSFVWSADNTATNVMNDTVSGISGTTDWFPIFVVIGAMVVLILLTVIIIRGIRGSGLMAGETA